MCCHAENILLDERTSQEYQKGYGGYDGMLFWLIYEHGTSVLWVLGGIVAGVFSIWKRGIKTWHHSSVYHLGQRARLAGHVFYFFHSAPIHLDGFSHGMELLVQNRLRLFGCSYIRSRIWGLMNIKQGGSWGKWGGAPRLDCKPRDLIYIPQELQYLSSKCLPVTVRAENVVT